ncbi:MULTISPECIES: hypothetical protein [Roseomonadaceae]|uniref:Uncharacterized protein n=1 Tax=Falsiroseomonas oleicola TaxID=2801474 RepID=A0ABS6H867_9PROT|nr:hypothetical protein [Roseomonas oleicola]MBU8544002.1 hypothetical protein [Roseomonas oleicola]
MARTVLGDAVLVTTTTTGTGTYALGSAVAGYFHPADANVASGSRVSFVVVDSLTAPTAREIGEGVLTTGSPWTLTRATIRNSLFDGASVSGSALNWPAGTRYVFLTPIAARTPQLDTDNALHAVNVPKAWAVFNGSGLIASHGIASITDHGVGDVTFTFDEAFPDANYCILGTASLISSDGAITTFQPRSDTSQIAASACRMLCSYDVSASGRTAVDAPYMSVSFLGEP